MGASLLYNSTLINKTCLFYFPLEQKVTVGLCVMKLRCTWECPIPQVCLIFEKLITLEQQKTILKDNPRHVNLAIGKVDLVSVFISFVLHVVMKDLRSRNLLVPRSSWRLWTGR